MGDGLLDRRSDRRRIPGSLDPATGTYLIRANIAEDLGFPEDLEPLVYCALRGKLIRLADRGWLRKLPDGRFTTRL